jgi:hypothetical protein
MRNKQRQSRFLRLSLRLELCTQKTFLGTVLPKLRKHPEVAKLVGYNQIMVGMVLQGVKLTQRLLNSASHRQHKGET